MIQALGLVKDELMCRTSALDFTLEIILLILNWLSQASPLDSWCRTTKGLKDPWWMTSLTNG
jgi:hypothetical protein